jgi:hypothetical protein
MLRLSDEATLQQRGIEIARMGLELAEQRTELSAAARRTSDKARLTRAWSQELRRRRPSWCARCRQPFTADDPGRTATYVPAGEAVAEETRTIHQACVAAWIIGRVRPAPWLEFFRSSNSTDPP